MKRQDRIKKNIETLQDSTASFHQNIHIKDDIDYESAQKENIHDRTKDKKIIMENSIFRVTQKDFKDSRKIDISQAVSPFEFQNMAKLGSGSNVIFPLKNSEIPKLTTNPLVLHPVILPCEQDIFQILKVQESQLFQIFCQKRNRQNHQILVVYSIKKQGSKEKFAIFQINDKRLWYDQQDIRLKMNFENRDGSCFYRLEEYKKNLDQASSDDQFKNLASFVQTKAFSLSMIKAKVTSKSMRTIHSSCFLNGKSFYSKNVEFNAKTRQAYITSKFIKMKDTTPSALNTIIQDVHGRQKAVIFFRRQKIYLALNSEQIPSYLTLCLAASRIHYSNILHSE